MALVVTKPGGIKWGGVEYAFGEVLPPGVASEMVRHPNYPALVGNGYVAATGSHEAVMLGLSEEKDDLSQASAVVPDMELDLSDLEVRRGKGKAGR